MINKNMKYYSVKVWGRTWHNMEKVVFSLLNLGKNKWTIKVQLWWVSPAIIHENDKVSSRYEDILIGGRDYDKAHDLLDLLDNNKLEKQGSVIDIDAILKEWLKENETL